MTDPYAGPRGAVAAWSGTSRASPSSAAPGGPGGVGIFAANQSAVGVYTATLGALVATYPATGYARWLDWVSVVCSHIGRVEIYYGAVEAPGRITSYGDGSLSEFDPNRPRYIPSGAPVMVVWTVPDATHNASCVAGFRSAD